MNILSIYNSFHIRCLVFEDERGNLYCIGYMNGRVSPWLGRVDDENYL